MDVIKQQPEVGKRKFELSSCRNYSCQFKSSKTSRGNSRYFQKSKVSIYARKRFLLVISSVDQSNR